MGSGRCRSRRRCPFAVLSPPFAAFRRPITTTFRSLSPRLSPHFAAFRRPFTTFRCLSPWLPPALQIKTLEPVPAGGELCISYIDTNAPCAARRAKLRKQYNFDCGCARCTVELATAASTKTSTDPPLRLSYSAAQGQRGGAVPKRTKKELRERREARQRQQQPPQSSGGAAASDDSGEIDLDDL